MQLQAPIGTKDILPENAAHWQYLEDTIRQICRQAAYLEIRTPMFEYTELFLRGIGDTTDIVQKEMYTFNDQGNRSLTLRPEGTASTVRAYLENKMYAEGMQPAKLYYIWPMFRYDRPQAGRYRQFHQFGVEAIGTQDAAVDAEVISLAILFFKKLGLNDLTLYLNSVGCPNCRPTYRDKLQNFFRDKLSNLCQNCQSRFERNPMRILDCKNETCAEYTQGAPQMLECLCGECHDHFEELKNVLKTAGIDFQINTRLVRGLDYYTKTAFEIQYAPLGSQSAVCGGGRYDGLAAEIGGQQTPGIGFGLGLERTLLALEKQGLLKAPDNSIKVFVAPLSKEAQSLAFKLIYELRQANIAADMDYMKRSVKAQMRHANKYPAEYVVLIGEDELKSGKIILKNMNTGEQQLIDPASLTDMLSK